jgi:diaminopimelate epimerase
MKFTKMNGLGNDYIFINAMLEQVVDPENAARKLCDRHFSIGGDGLVLIDRGRSFDFSMRMFNADGGEAEMCGNAIRCVGKYLFDKGITDKTTLHIETKAGVKRLTLVSSAEGLVMGAAVNMGAVRFVESAKPIKVRAISRDFVGYNVTAGNPHFVIFVDSYFDGIMEEGKAISENTIVFPERTNVEFVLNKVENDEINMRVYERGTGETLACGTGAASAFFVCNSLDMVSDEAKVNLPGGQLDCYKKNEEIFIRGKAEYNFEGEVLW